MVGEVPRCLTVYRQPYIITRFHSFLANIQNSSPLYVMLQAAEEGEHSVDQFLHDSNVPRIH